MGIIGIGQKGSLLITNQIENITSNKRSIDNTGIPAAVQNDSVNISDAAKNKLSDRCILDSYSRRSFDLLKSRKISDKDMVEFKKIIDDAEYASDAKAFLKSLSKDELALVKRGNGYGHTINDSHINSMNEEGARNLLVQPDNRFKVDYDNNGIVESGVANLFIFPPPNSSEEVKDAWDKMTESMSDEERLMAELPFAKRAYQANMLQDESGKAIRYISSDEKGYTNIFPTEKNDWLTLLDEIDAHLDIVEKYSTGNNKLHREEDRQIINSFRNHLL